MDLYLARALEPALSSMDQSRAWKLFPIQDVDRWSHSYSRKDLTPEVPTWSCGMACITSPGAAYCSSYRAGGFFFLILTDATQVFPHAMWRIKYLPRGVCLRNLKVDWKMQKSPFFTCRFKLLEEGNYNELFVIVMGNFYLASATVSLDRDYNGGRWLQALMIWYQF